MGDEKGEAFDFFSQPETVGIEEDAVPEETLPDGPPTPHLLFISGPELGRSIRLGKAGADIGRSTQCDITVADRHVSRRHAEVQQTEEGYELRDLDSRNGSWVNGERLDGVSPLEEGTRCRLGKETVVAFIFQDPTEESFHRELYENSIRDELTGAYDNNYLKRRLTSIVRSSRGSEATAQLMIFDVDDFKRVNDCCGHQAGDAVLETIAEITRETLETEEAMFARYGGDEFAAAFVDASDDRVWWVAEELVDAVERTDFGLDGMEDVTISIGLASTDVIGSAESAELIYAADRALYSAKQEGGNPIVRRGEGDEVEEDRTLPPES